MANASIKNARTYEGLRGGRSSKYGRIDSGSYYDWSVHQLKKRAKELGMSGYSALTKEDLIYKLRYP